MRVSSSSSDNAEGGKFPTETQGTKETAIRGVLRRANRRIALGIQRLGQFRSHEFAHEENGEGGGDDDDDDAAVGDIFFRVKRRGRGRREDEKRTLIFLHGFGDSAEQWEEFARTISSVDDDEREEDALLDVGAVDKVVLPSAPKRYFVRETRNELFSGRCWFAPRLLPTRLEEEEEEEKEGGLFLCKGLGESRERIKRLVEREEGKVVLSGFSQGAALAISLAFSEEAKKPQNLIGCLSFRGYLPRCKLEDYNEDYNEQSAPTRENSTKVLMLAGGNDPLVPMRWTMEAKAKGEAKGLDIQAYYRECSGHNLNVDDVLRAKRWLRERFSGE